MAKALKSFKFKPQVYESFKQLTSKNGYTVTGAFEKFMESAIDHGLIFPSP